MEKWRNSTTCWQTTIVLVSHDLFSDRTGTWSKKHHEPLWQQVAELISPLLLSDTGRCKVPQRDTTSSGVIRSDTKPLYDYVRVIKTEMCYFDKWVRENHVGVLTHAQIDEWKMALISRGACSSAAHLLILYREYCIELRPNLPH